MNKREFGEKLEQFAAQKLNNAGLKIVAQNYLCKMGEIDLIARDGDDLVFVEVRYRKSQQFGGPLESVDRKKQRRIALAAEHYLQAHKLTNRVPCRFDIFAISGQHSQIDFKWIKAAFGSF